MAKISPAKESYVFQEPIRLNLTIFNAGRTASTLSLIVPYFNGELILSEGSQELARREEYAREGLGGRSIPRGIEPGGSVEFPIFLQTYYASPRPGLHELHYTMSVPCLVQGGGTDSISSGTFFVRIDPTDPEKLKRIVADYTTQLANGDPAAPEALLSMDTPLVIPQLKEMMEGSHFARAFQALSRFKGDPQAEQIVRETVHAKLPARQIAGIKVLSKWNQGISSADVGSLLESTSRDVRIAALRYLQALRDPNYLPLLSPLLNDADQSVAGEAQRTRELLRAKTPKTR